MPEKVREAVEVYRENNNWLVNFLNDCCVVENFCNEKSGRLYEVYREYCTRMGDFARSTTDFYGALLRKGHARKRNRYGSFVLGLKLRPEWNE